MRTTWIDLPVTGENMPAYLAEPEGTPRGGIIVIQEIFGVNAAMRAIAELLAGEGYLAIAPAIFHRTDPHFEAPVSAAGVEKGRAAAGGLDLQQMVADLTACAEAIRERLGPDAKIGTCGFCFGGSVAYLSATLPFVSAAVSFYGGQIATSKVPTRPPMIEVTREIHAPLFLAYGRDDESIPMEDVEKIRTALETRGATFDLRVYDGVGHAFFRQGPTSGDAAADAWNRVRTLFETHVASA